jgi:pimeloyl-ACP methyl ester carboxylesterase
VDDGPQRVTVPAGPVRLSALDYGGDGPGPSPADDRPPMLLLHGHADLAWSMDSVAQAFRDRYRVVSMDLRGHGESDHPGAYSILHFVADLAATIDHLGLDRPVLVAHSLGGHVASQFSGLYPDVPRALVLVEGMGPPARLSGDTAESRADLHRTVVELLRTPFAHKALADPEAAVDRLRAAHPGLDPERAHFLADVGTRPGPDGGLVWRFDLRTRDWFASIDQPLTEERWRAVRCPVLAVSGAESWERWWGARMSPVAKAEGRERLTDEEWRARLANFADLELVDVAGAGHLVHFDQPERLNEVIDDFLRRRLPPP